MPTLPAAAAPSQVPSDTVGADGDVLAVTHVGERVFVGGSFSYVGRYTNAGAVVDEEGGSVASQNARVKGGSIRAGAKDLRGGWFLGGDFNEVASTPRGGLIRVLSSGWTADWAPTVDGVVDAIAYDGDLVYVGGTFSHVNGVPRANLAAVDADTGELHPWDPGTDGAVSALALSGGDVVVGGDFSRLGDQDHASLAVVDRLSGAPAGALDVVGAVDELEVLDGTLYVGGNFTSVDGASRSNLAAVDMQARSLTAWAPQTNGPVRALAIRRDATAIYIGGSFDLANGRRRSNVAAFDTATGLLEPLDVAVSGGVHDLELSRNTPEAPRDAVLYLAGDFDAVQQVTRYRTAAIDTSTAEVTAWHPSTSATTRVVSRSGGNIYLGGDFEWMNGAPRANLAAIDARTGDLVGDWRADTDGPVRALAASVDGTTLHVGGDFSRVGGLARTRLAAVGTDRAEVSSGWDPAPNGGVRALATSATAVFVGGSFTRIGGLQRQGVAALHVESGAALAAFDTGVDGSVRALVTNPEGTRLYVGGSYKKIGGQRRPGFSEVSAATGAVTTFAPTRGGDVIAAGRTPSGSRVFAATTSNRTIAYHPQVGNSPVWEVHSGGDVQAMAASTSELFVGGHFTRFPEVGVSRLHAASLDVATGALTGWDPRPDGAFGVWAIDIIGEDVFIGGDFDKVGGNWTRRLAHFRSTP